MSKKLHKFMANPLYSRQLPILSQLCQIKNLQLNFAKRALSSQSNLCKNGQTESSSTQHGKNSKSSRLKDGPSFKHFLTKNALNSVNNKTEGRNADYYINEVPYVEKEAFDGSGRKVFYETYGCQMNVNDTEIATSVLESNGFVTTHDIKQADVIFLMTCSIRESAERKIWKRLRFLRHLKMKRKSQNTGIPLRIGILGCMASRLKENIMKSDETVDLVCGPDAYKDLPRLLSVASSGQSAVNIQLSLDETYADVLPVRVNENSPSAFVSIMRGCDNMCTYCIVPFTRGKERSRPISSIVEEIRILSDQGIKDVTLLGQNVNSYRDMSESSSYGGLDVERPTNLSSDNFKTVYKNKIGGRRFSDLLNHVSSVDPEMRIRFTAPHPKDFPDEVLQLIKERPNICNQIHLPAQSGNNDVLSNMRRGYTREAYIDLVHHIRDIIPDVALTSDFIAGFCGETEQAHEDTVSLMKMVKYNFAFCYPYSMRQKTKAFHRLNDDVPQDVKSRRALELIEVFRKETLKVHQNMIGKKQLILIESVNKRLPDYMAGRNYASTMVFVPNVAIPCEYRSLAGRKIKPGDYVVAEITLCSSKCLQGIPLHHTTLTEFHNRYGYVNHTDNMAAQEPGFQDTITM